MKLILTLITIFNLFCFRADAACSNGFFPVTSLGCVYVETAEPMTFDYSSIACYQKWSPANMISIHSLSQVANLIQLTQIANYQELFHIGLYQSDGEWRWADGSVVDFFNFAPGEPNNATSPQLRCIEMDSQGLWYAYNCQDAFAYICQANNAATTTNRPATNRYSTTISPICSPNPCKNGGTCTAQSGGTYSCICRSPWTRPNCVVQNVCLLGNPCQNGGTCVQDGNSSVCNCLPQYTGRTCQSVISCASGPCHNGGTCIQLPSNAYKCQCPLPYTGTQCESLYGACEVYHPCKNGATCVNDASGSYTCICPHNYLGPVCALSLPCAANPCKNSATCANTGTSANQFKCNCTAQFMGRTCTVSVCNVSIRNRGWYILQSTYTDGTSSHSVSIDFGGTTTFKAAMGSALELHADAGRSTSCTLSANVCDNSANVNCYGTTFAGFSCTCE